MEDELKPFDYNLFALAFKVPGAIEYFTQHLLPEDVGLPEGNIGLNQFYIALCNFYNKTGVDRVDPVAFQEWLSHETDIESAIGGPAAVKLFLDQILAIDELSTPEAVAALLHYKSARARQQECLLELQGLLLKRELSEPERIRIGVLASEIRSIAEETGIDPMSRVMTGDDIAEATEALWELPDFLPTPYPELNKCLGYSPDLGGVIKGCITAVLAASGEGKSTFAKCLTKHWLELGYSVLYVNYEEVASHWNRILMTQITGLNAYLGPLLDPQAKEEATREFKRTVREWSDRLMVLHDPETAYFEDLERWLREFATRSGKAPDAIVIDTIQSMFTKGGGGRPRWGQYEEMMVRLEKLAKELGSAVLLTAQENTNRMKERRDVVLQSDTGGSISIVQKCSVTIHLVRKNMSGDDDSLDSNIMELQIPKNRITGQTFSGSPPHVIYRDDKKSFEVWDPVAPDRYQKDYNQPDFDDFLDNL